MGRKNKKERWFERIYEYLIEEFDGETAAKIVLEYVEDGYLSDSILELARRLMTKDEFMRLLQKIDKVNHEGLYLLFEEEYYE